MAEQERELTISEIQQELQKTNELLQSVAECYEEINEECQNYIAGDPELAEHYDEYLRELGATEEAAFDSEREEKKMTPGEMGAGSAESDVEKSDTTERLAADLEAFGRDFSPYEYADTFDAGNFDRTVEQLLEGNTEEIADWLTGILEEDPENQEARDLLERVESMGKGKPEQEEVMPKEEKTEEKPDRLDCLLIKKGCYPERVTIDNTLESLQASVGGLIQEFYFVPEDVAIVCNEEGKINGMEPNRAIRDEYNRVYDIIFGDFLIVGLTEEDFGSLTPEQMDRYDEIFHQPEDFIDIAGHICVIPVLPEEDLRMEENYSEQQMSSEDQKMPEAEKTEGHSR